jgi:hypothetical protein
MIILSASFEGGDEMSAATRWDDAGERPTVEQVVANLERERERRPGLIDYDAAIAAVQQHGVDAVAPTSPFAALTAEEAEARWTALDAAVRQAAAGLRAGRSPRAAGLTGDARARLAELARQRGLDLER